MDTLSPHARGEFEGTICQKKPQKLSPHARGEFDIQSVEIPGREKP